MKVSLPGVPSQKGEGRNKKLAEQSAAAAMLDFWGVRMEQNTENLTRSGFVALIGAPNAGKSTITNNFVGSKVSIVSPKVQTTRTMVRGIGVYDNTQIIFIDTPGIFKPKRRLDRAMVSSAWSGVKDADIVVLVVDAKRGFDDETQSIVAKLNKQK